MFAIVPRFALTLEMIEKARREGLKAFTDGKRSVLCREKPKGSWWLVTVQIPDDRTAA